MAKFLAASALVFALIGGSVAYAGIHLGGGHKTIIPIPARRATGTTTIITTARRMISAAKYRALPTDILENACD